MVKKISATPPMCIRCEHLDRGAIKYSCKAFPNGIPMEIIYGDVKHYKSIEGDNGIIFKRRKK